MNASSRAYRSRTGPEPFVGEETLTWGCVASISGIEVGEASRRRLIVVKEWAKTINANDNNMALAA
jgi:hypothetical protein